MEEALAQRIRPLTVEGMDTDQLKDRLQVMLMLEMLVIFPLLGSTTLQPPPVCRYSALPALSAPGQRLLAGLNSTGTSVSTSGKVLKQQLVIQIECSELRKRTLSKYVLMRFAA